MATLSPAMPLYEYECQACGNKLEIQQRMADAALTTCPSCGKDELQKLISASAFHLKGGGWYKDLYASAKPGAESKPENKTESSTVAKTSTDSVKADSPKGDSSKADKGDKGGGSTPASGSGSGSGSTGSGSSSSSASATA